MRILIVNPNTTAAMTVKIVNQGPVTILLDSKKAF